MPKLDILFVHPNGAKKIYQSLSDKRTAIEPPIWAALLTNHCLSKGFNSEILDCEAEGLSTEESAEIINSIDSRIVCFVVYGQQPSASSQNMVGATDTSNRVKELNPNIKILYVGGHIAALPSQTLSDEPSIDFICQNEGVYTISTLLQVSNLEDVNQLKKVKGLGFRDNGGTVILNPPSPIVPKDRMEVDLPGMAWNSLPSLSKYRTAGWHSWSNDSEKAPFASLYTSLGCPYKCSFCMINIISRTDPSPNVASDKSNFFRWWSPDFIINQFDYLANQGVRNIKIADELFVLNPNHFMKICDLIIERGYNFNIWAYSRIDTCKPEYLDTLKKAGVNWLGLGIENPNQVLRKEVHKGSYKEVKINDIIKVVQDSGINVGGNYIFGLPFDTAESMQETLDFSLQNKTEMVNYYCAMAYPGSPLHIESKNKGTPLPSDYVGYSQHSYETFNLPTETLSSSEVLRFRDHAWNTYNTDKDYLNLLEDKFGAKARLDMEETTKVTLSRKLLDD
jgi:radical SAM superfamily enzyme YgiQ (UPF0313 family)